MLFLGGVGKASVNVSMDMFGSKCDRPALDEESMVRYFVNTPYKLGGSEAGTQADRAT